MLVDKPVAYAGQALVTQPARPGFKFRLSFIFLFFFSSFSRSVTNRCPGSTAHASSPMRLSHPLRILGDPGAVSRVDKMSVVKVYCKIATSPWALRVLSIMPKIPEISVRIQMERSVSVSSDRNIRDHFWRWSTYFGVVTKRRNDLQPPKTS